MFMPVIIASDNFLLRQSEADRLWQEVVRLCQCPDDLVTIKSVEEEEMVRLNKQYRQKDKPTNILTFSYGEGEHDVAICLAVARREALERKIGIKEYTIILVTHAFLHAAGLDHEASVTEAQTMTELENMIVKAKGLLSDHL
jgi:probable rRNA maturation factor